MLTYSSIFFLALFTCLTTAIALPTIAISHTPDAQTLIICSLAQRSSYLNCTTFPNQTRFQIPYNSSYSRIVGGKGFLCALRSLSNSIMVCWRFGNDITSPDFKRIYHGSDLSDLTSGDSHVCGIVKQTNQIECWQWKGFKSTFDSELNFSNVAVGDDFVCGLNEFGNVICEGSNTIVNDQIPKGNYTSIEASSNYACALASDGTPSCWGKTISGLKGDEKFKSIALGEKSACGLRSNGTIACWGEDTSVSIPANTSFIAIEAKGSVFCGVVWNLTLLCWGNQTLLGDKSSLVFDNVLPGACLSSSSCSCGVMPGNFCGSGQVVCEICPLTQTPAATNLTSLYKSNRLNGKMIAFLVVGIVGSISLAASLVFWYMVVRQGNGRSSSRVHDSGRLDEESQGANSERRVDVEARGRRLEKRLSHIVSMGTIEEFSLQVLLQATNNFSSDLKIGTGSFGSVYKAELDDGRRVAIKRAEASISTSTGASTKRNEERDTAFLAELGFLSKLNHRNLVTLVGFYEDKKERVLIYEYMTNGSLHEHLHKQTTSPSPLQTWAGRLKVGVDAARGIEYLHIYAVPPVIHRDIKPSNILLDETWTAKVSDFGLSLMGPSEEEMHLSQLAAGTLGYIDPEYYRRHQLTCKSDVYSFGVVLLELLTGLKAIHLNENGLPRNVVDFVIPYINRDEIHRVLDPTMPPPTPIEIEALAHVGHLAAECVSLESRDRPSMPEIVASLDADWRIATLGPNTIFSSSTNSSYGED